MWCWKCIHSHQLCSRSVVAGGWLPTRLLDVSPRNRNRRVFLRSSAQIPPGTEYITLSHIWGCSSGKKLTRLTMKEIKNGIKSEELSLTFQHTIEITRALNVQFLWIDALCIIQGADAIARKDWAHEAALMGKVYKNSYLNVSTLDAVDSLGGCFHERDVIGLGRCDIDVEFTINRSSVPCTALGKYHVVPRNTWYHDVEQAPVNQRGWVLQERLLARRTVYFGRQRVLWECGELYAHEFDPDGTQITEMLDKPPIITSALKTLYVQRSFKNVSISASLGSGSESSDFEATVIAFWRQIVNLYSTSKLTRSEDKLVALSGIAKEFQYLMGEKDTYLAGLWREHLALELLWVVDQRKGARVDTYRAPSWSWASVEGEIIWPWNIDHKDNIVLISIVDARVTPLNQNNEGQVKFGCLALRGPIILGERLMFRLPPDEVEPPENPQQPWRLERLYLDISSDLSSSHRKGNDFLTLDARFDGPINLQKHKPLLLLVYRNACEFGGLVLGETADGAVVQRLGRWQSLGDLHQIPVVCHVSSERKIIVI